MRLYGNEQASANHAPALYPVLSLLLGASLWGLIWYPMRLLEAAGLNGIWLALILYGSALLVSLPRVTGAFAEFSRFPLSLLLLALAAGWTNVAFMLAVLEGNIVRVMLLFYLSPLWAVLMAWLFLAERISLLSFASLILSLTGAVIMLWSPNMGLPWPQGRVDWLAISAGFTFAMSNVVTRKMADTSIAAKSLSTWLGVVVVAMVLIILLGLPAPRAAPQVFFGAILLGGAGILSMTWLIQYGVTHMPVQRSAVIMLFELVVGAGSQQLLTNEHMSLHEWTGGLLIVIAAYGSAKR
jgi:drug/metabolite transporter (DMT)-like permease